MSSTEDSKIPGIIWCNSRINQESDLSKDAFTNWYQHVHLPDVVKTGAVTQAQRYEAVDQEEGMFHLALYYSPNMTGLIDSVSSKSFILRDDEKSTEVNIQTSHIIIRTFQDRRMCSTMHSLTLGSTNSFKCTHGTMTRAV